MSLSLLRFFCRYSIPLEELFVVVDLAHELPMEILDSLDRTERAHLLPPAQLPSSVCDRARQGRSPDSVSAEDHDE